ncbi:hypothetical protein GR183_02640 [Stappia sp. GBMRC 2046]|uniref:Uncharacterized protein n=1 Tax=Stappia sediminis TaxID=2692190 RepID=A0A7X3LRK1_9HYPH|nr:hypothetical protein [Stappia sediminis]MXN63791.1 hypothetical protein [Stappia sediminis]
MDIATILNYGVIGLGFLLAFLAFRLLSKPKLTTAAASNVRWFLAFSVVVCLLGLASEWLRRSFDVADVSQQVEALTKDNERLEAENAKLLSQAERWNHAYRFLMTSSQADTVSAAIEAYSTARSEIDKILSLVERSCSGGSSGINPANYPAVLRTVNSARNELATVQSALDVCSSLAPQ